MEVIRWHGVSRHGGRNTHPGPLYPWWGREMVAGGGRHLPSLPFSSREGVQAYVTTENGNIPTAQECSPASHCHHLQVQVQFPVQYGRNTQASPFHGSRWWQVKQPPVPAQVQVQVSHLVWLTGLSWVAGGMFWCR